MNITFIDLNNIPYDGSTLTKTGLGGSESAVIYMARALVNIGFTVTVYNACTSDVKHDTSPGLYDGVTYLDVSVLPAAKFDDSDVIISLRSVIPFIGSMDAASKINLTSIPYPNITESRAHKIAWMHDTFCAGDILLEHLVVNEDIDEIFTLSDFHTSYITTCHHGHRRMMEVLKSHIYETRNGATFYGDEVDISKKDPNMFVYNAAVSKGLSSLVHDVWPLVKQQLPNATLTVIGGYYRNIEDGHGGDVQYRNWLAMATDSNNAKLDISFVGIVPPSTVADLFKRASYTIYPPEFPETYGISTLESLMYNTPVITSRFGALEEVAIANACYLIDYPIQPNSLYPTINKQQQVNDFVAMVVAAYNDKYLHSQKMQYCNIVKSVASWNTIALQWKQHLFHKLHKYLPLAEYRAVAQINNDVHRVFNRTTTNALEVYEYRNSNQAEIIVVTPMYNASQWIEQCITSVSTQDYDNWHMYIIDDASADDSVIKAQNAICQNPKITLIQNKTNRGALFNQVNTILAHGDDESIIMLIDGDDSLMPDNQIFQYYNNQYHSGAEFTYGSMMSLADNIPLIAQQYPTDVINNKTFRQYKFPWNMPYTHLRTFKRRLLTAVNTSEFKDSDGNWFNAGGDNALFYSVIEQATANGIRALPRIVYQYNDLNPANDYKIHNTEQQQTALTVTSARSYPKTILIAIPTNKYIEPATMKAIYDLIVPVGYTTEFQYFYGYQIDQIRNLIADWAKRYNYVFCIDSDISFKPNTLQLLLQDNKPIVSGVYIQRKPDVKIPELYVDGNNMHIDEVLSHTAPFEIDACGFGCVLIDCDVIRQMTYPHFVYQSAIDHKHTISEDVFFCNKAKQLGYTVWADPRILCEHHGSATYTP